MVSFLSVEEKFLPVNFYLIEKYIEELLVTIIHFMEFSTFLQDSSEVWASSMYSEYIVVSHTSSFIFLIAVFNNNWLK